MNIQLVLGGAALLLLGFALGRWTAPRERQTVVYQSAPPRAAGNAAAATDGDAEILAYVRAGQPIQAIRRHRELYGSSLRDAKAAVDALRGA